MTFRNLVLSISLVVFLSCNDRQSLPMGSTRRPFNSTLWLAPHSSAWREGGISIREEMLADLVSSILPGKTRSEIESNLGPSLKTDYFSSIPKDLIYYLGPERGSFINIDSEWLLIWFDAEGNFKKYALYND